MRTAPAATATPSDIRVAAGGAPATAANAADPAPAAPPFTRIALVTDAWLPQVNGVVTTYRNLVAELASRGIEVEVIAPERFRTFPMPRYPEIRLSILPGRGLRRALDDFAPEAIHVATEGPLGLAGRRYCRRRKLHFTTSWHTQFPAYVQKYTGIPAGLTYKAVRWFHGAGEATLVPTPSIRDELEERGFRNIRVWTRGVDHRTFRPRADRAASTEDVLGVALERPVFVHVGRVAVEKNIEAFLELDLPGTKLVVGDGPAKASLEKKYPGAHWAGFHFGEDLARHYACGDVFVFPSRTDTFGVVLIEAMASGLPVAAYPVTGPRDVVTDAAAGVLDEDLGAACRRALELDPADARRHAERFSWAACADIFLDTLVRAEPSAG